MDWTMFVCWAAGFLMGMAATLMLGAAGAAGQADQQDERRAARDEARRAGGRGQGAGETKTKTDITPHHTTPYQKGATPDNTIPHHTTRFPYTDF